MVAPSAKLTFFNELHPLNISDAFPVKLAGKVISSNRVHSEKALYPASDKEFGNSTSVRFLHPSKA